MKTWMEGLRTCIYKVPDLEAAKKWYAKISGKEPYFDQPFYVGFNIGGFELGLVPEETEGDRLRAENILVYWGVKDIGAAFQDLLDQGATVHEAPHSVGGEIMVASVKDPWENVLGLIYNPEFKIENQ